MNPLSVPAIVMASITFYVGAYHLLIYFRRMQQRVDLTFALTCIAVGFYDVFCAGLYSASSPLEGVHWQRAQFVTVALVGVALLWFVIDYTRSKSGWLAYVFSGFFVLAAIVELAGRSDLTWRPDRPAIKEVVLPVGLKVTYQEAAQGVFSDIQAVVGLSLFFYLFWMLVQCYRAGRRREAPRAAGRAPLLICLALLFVSVLNDSAVGMGVYRFLYTIEYAYMGTVLLMTYSMTRDVVEAAVTRETLRKTEARLEMAIQGAEIGLWDWNVRGGAVTMNGRVFEMLGYGRSDVAPDLDAWRALIHPDDLPQVVAVLRANMDGHSGFCETEYRFKTNSGEWKWVSSRGKVVERAPDGTALRMAGTLLDIDERKRAEQALRESEERFRALTENSPDLIFRCDRACRFVYVNPAVAAATAMECSEFLGRTPRELGFPEDFCRRFEDRVGKVFHGSLPQIDVSGFQRPAGRRIFDWRFAREFAAADSVETVLVTARDITEQRHLEEQLRQSEKMEAIGHLAGGIAHDFNNQLTGIMGYADMLWTLLADEEQSRFAEMILKASRRASDLTAQLLAFARKGNYQCVTVNLHQVMSEVIALLEHSIDRRIRIRQVLGANPPLTTGDPTQIQSALLNIAINARDSMPNGGELTFATDVVTLDEAYCRTQPFEVVPGRYVQVDITDTGVGMTPDLLRHIFEPFFTTKETGRGTGMGLAAVYGTVKNHRAAISVESIHGQGTTFRILWPLAESAEEEDRVHAAPVRAQHGARILVVDDDEIVCRMARDMLGGLGYRVTTCADGKQAVALYRDASRRFDLVILDLIMPELGGADTFRALREIDPDARVLLSSGYRLDGDAEHLLEAGAAGFIPKPFQMAALSEAVAAALAP